MPTRFDKLLVLDLDETLFLAREDPLSRPPDFHVGSYSIYKRPGVDQFLQTCREWFKLGVWTSSTKTYATEILRQLKLEPADLAIFWTRERCTRKLDPTTQSEVWIKDFRKLKRIGFDLNKTICVDDSADKHSRQYGNLLRIAEYLGDVEDCELFLLLEYLAILGPVENVRAVEKRGWRSVVLNRSRGQT